MKKEAQKKEPYLHVEGSKTGDRKRDGRSVGILYDC